MITMGKCKNYKKAPPCPQCGQLTGIVSQSLRYCEHCDQTFELSEEDKALVVELNKKGFGYPKDFDKEQFKRTHHV
jgi:hypothetical protein